MTKSESGSGWARVAKSITSPLALVSLFFIADVICLRFLLPLDTSKTNNPNILLAEILVGVAALIVLVVCGLLIFKPENLVFDQEAILRNRGKAPFGTEKKSTKKETEEKSVTPTKTITHNE